MVRLAVIVMLGLSMGCSKGSAPSADTARPDKAAVTATGPAAKAEAEGGAKMEGSKLSKPVVEGLEIEFDYALPIALGDQMVPGFNGAPGHRSIQLNVSQIKPTAALASVAAGLEKLGYAPPANKNERNHTDYLQTYEKDGVQVKLRATELPAPAEDGHIGWVMIDVTKRGE